jgi:putative hemolysin
MAQFMDDAGKLQAMTLQPGAILGARGQLTVRLAAGPAEIEAAQHLRYRVFYEELSAKPDELARETRRDADAFDAICDHLLVVHHLSGHDPDPITVEGGELVGTYRVLRQDVAERHGGFYTQAEFDIAPMIARHPGLNVLELGRSCVLRPYRTKPVVELLWQGIWSYVHSYRLGMMLGCASLEGTDPREHDLALSYLAHFHAAPEEWRVRALPRRHVEMQRLPKSEIDVKKALKLLPPLIKGYLRLGCFIGDGAVIDEQFNTVDVLIILPVSAISTRYFSRFSSHDEIASANR